MADWQANFTEAWQKRRRPGTSTAPAAAAPKRAAHPAQAVIAHLEKRMQIHLAVLAWKRPALLARTLYSFASLNCLRPYRLWYGVEAGAPPEMDDLLHSFGFECVAAPAAHIGTARMWHQVLSGVLDKGDPSDLVLWLEEDWECVRPVPIPLILEVWRRYRIAMFRLFGRFRERGPDGCTRMPTGTSRPGEPVAVWEKPHVWREEVWIGPNWWAFPPGIARLDAAENMLRDAADERQVINKSMKMAIRIAWQPDNPVFWHIGYRNAKDQE
jgi:hypothetical protein